MRNENGKPLSEFDNLINFFIANSALKHSARHYMKPAPYYKNWKRSADKHIRTFNQIDYDVMPQCMKAALTKSRS